MKIVNQEINGIWCKIYQPKTPSSMWAIWLHGLGEKGPLDGSKINAVELYDSTGKPVSWTAQAASGFEFPFNIIAPQIPTTMYSDYWMLANGAKGSEGWFVNYVKETLGAAKIVVTGYSLGGRGAWTLLRWDTKSYIDAIVSVCGYYDATLGAVCNLRSIPGYSVHGTADLQMNYQWDVDNIKAYNACPGRPTQVVGGLPQLCHYLQSISGAGHSVWPIAYDVTSGKDAVLQWVLAQFGPQSLPSPDGDKVATSYVEGQNLIIITASGKKYSTLLQTL